MKDTEQNEKEFPGTKTADLLTDSLLKNVAANPEGADDEAFLAQVEAAMDAEDRAGNQAAATTEGATAAPEEVRKGRWKSQWAGGIAALLMAGIGATMFWKTQLAQNELPGGHSGDNSQPAMPYAKSPSDTHDETNSFILEKRVSADADRYAPVAMAESAAEVASVESEKLPRRPHPNSAYNALAAGPAIRAEEIEQELGGKWRRYSEHLSESRRSRQDFPTGSSPVALTPSPPSSKRYAAGYGSIGAAPKPKTGPRYGEIIDNQWNSPIHQPLSTFSIDVDTASWTNIRGMLDRGVPLESIPKDAVRIEEMINYFDWKYPQPDGKHPFGFAVESASCPWNEENQLLRVAIQGKDLKRHKRPPANLVFLLDVSGSMNQPDKLPLVQRAISILIEELNEEDCVSIVVYAGSEGVALEPTQGNKQGEILAALNRLQAGGSTNGGAGIDLAYKMAADNFNKNGVNRVILCTDGDFNVGRTGTESLVEFVERKAKRDRVFLSVCGFGDDNLNDAMLEAITNKGNGNYYYIDGFAEARKVFLKDLTGTLVTIAKDVKIQIEFNPGQVKAYRLIGYANRQLEDRDFEDDRVDAGEIGAGHSVTAFYEIVPAGSKDDPVQTTSNLRYQKTVEPEPAPEPKRRIVPNPELALLKLRYKKPDGNISTFLQQTVMPSDRDWRKASADFRFASAVALFGLKLRDHESAQNTELLDIIAIASKAAGNDPHGYREEFVRILKQARD